MQALALLPGIAAAECADPSDVKQITTRDAIAERFPAAGKIEHRRSPGRV